MRTVPNPPHDAYVHTFTAASQKMHRAQCRSCAWHGISSGDRDRATSEAADHRGAVGVA